MRLYYPSFHIVKLRTTGTANTGRQSAGLSTTRDICEKRSKYARRNVIMHSVLISTTLHKANRTHELGM